jgi:hypothetical protein
MIYDFINQGRQQLELGEGGMQQGRQRGQWPAATKWVVLNTWALSCLLPDTLFPHLTGF